MMPHSSLLSGERLRAGPPRRRHPWRWVFGGLLALAVIVVVAVLAIVGVKPSQSPLALPAGISAAPAGLVNGTWHVTTGSVAGFRVRESFLGFGNDVTGRTSHVTGTVKLSGDRVTGATFRISLATITVDGKTGQPQLAKSLDTAADPMATVALASPVRLPAAFSSGTTVTLTTAATLTLDGITRPVTVTLSARRDGTKIEAAGSLPVAFAGFGIKGPAGYGLLGSLASDGIAEFLLVLSPAGTG
jgi:polyisoprenoid-binding protein YceI